MLEIGIPILAILALFLVVAVIVGGNLIEICQPNEVLVFSGMRGGERGFRLYCSRCFKPSTAST